MKQSRQENLIYLVVWGLLFATPLLSVYVRTMSDANAVFNWTEVFIVWRKFAVFLLLFLIHNFLLAPLLVMLHRRVAYFSIVAVVIAAFTVYQCGSRPEQFKRHGPHAEQRDRHEAPHFDEPPMALDGERPVAPPVDESHHTGNRPPRLSQHDGGPPPIVGERDIMAVMVLILMFGANLGIKGYFRSRDDRKRLAELERENLEQQLEYLRYQINPHFFMNTLNNIHALVDIDPEKAKGTILELSKMMRFVLYEGDKTNVPLSREVEFLKNYITLMRMRYNEHVRISVDLPDALPAKEVPPLLFITFVENAFKHGISYQQESFVEVKIIIQGDRLHFSCRNSKTNKPNEDRRQAGDGTSGTKGGVGLTNARKRLELIYANDFTLDINDTAEQYAVKLSIPL